MSDEPEESMARFVNASPLRHEVQNKLKDETWPDMAEGNQRRQTWTKAYQDISKKDQGMIEEWKSELDNLLIYAALYSAVITSFLVASIPLLVPDDDGDTLRNISTRIASYSLSNGFANATRLSSSTPAGSPPAYAITVNKLWLSSLVFGLVATFFSVAARQWLRLASIPLELQRVHYEACMKWHVPQIVVMLPALVQISVILFLAGLLVYVQQINQDVCRPLFIISGVFLTIFIVIFSIPIIDSSCPYKFPLLHIVWAPLILLLSLIKKTGRSFGIFGDIEIDYYLRELRGLIVVYASRTTVGQHIARDRRRLRQRYPKECLAQRALIYARMTGTALEPLIPCLKDLDPYYRTRCVLAWLSVQYNASDNPDAEDLFPDGMLKKNTFQYMNQGFADIYGALLMNVLAEDWHNKENDRSRDTDIPHIVALLWYLCILRGINTEYRDTTLRSAFIKELLELCLDWGTNPWWMRSRTGWEPILRIPAVLLCSSWEFVEREIKSDLEPLDVSVYANNVIEIANKIVQDVVLLQPTQISTSRWIAAEEHVFSVTANTLKIVLAAYGSMFSRQMSFQLSSLFQSLHVFILRGQSNIRETVRDWEEVNDSEWLPFVTRKAIVSICLSIEEVWRGGQMTSDLKPEGLLNLLVEICSERTSDDEMAGAKDRLQQLLDEEDQIRSGCKANEEPAQPETKDFELEGSRA